MKKRKIKMNVQNIYIVIESYENDAGFVVPNKIISVWTDEKLAIAEMERLRDFAKFAEEEYYYNIETHILDKGRY